MKIIAKFIPIEGPIPMGGQYMAKDNPNVITRSHADDEFYNDPEFTHVKGIFCSWETQVGDKVFCLDVHYNNPLHPPERYIDPWRIKSSGDTCNACVKIIGNISPNATWVRDGDVFTEDEINKILL